MPVAVLGLAVAAVKGTRLREVQSVSLEEDGVRENRRFYVIDGLDRMVNAKTVGELTTVVSDYSDADRRLALTFPDGRTLAGEIRLGEPVTTRFYSEPMIGRLVEGPWSEALSEHTGVPVRLVEAPDGAGAIDRGSVGAVSLISQASLARLAEAGGCDELDVRRFRMLIEIDGVPAHAEDAWVGRPVRVGEALVGFEGHVGRCLITSRDPDSGVIDVPTLDIIRSYRDNENTSEPLPFGIYGRVLERGTVRIGDAVLADL